MKKFATYIAIVALTFGSVTPSMAAVEIDEKDYGPTYGTMMADATIGKPLQALAVVGGALTWLISFPFTNYTGDSEIARQKLIDGPSQALDRCLGCTTEQDAYYKSQTLPENQVRLVIDGPSEVYINTDQNVVVNAP